MSINEEAASWDGRSVPALLTLDRLGPDLFASRINQPNLNKAIFGGQVLGQSLGAAAATTSLGATAAAAGERLVHSVHGYFLRAGAVGRPVTYTVERTRDGRSFSTRRVTAAQGGSPIFHMDCSFRDIEAGWERQFPIPDVPAPETLEPLAAIAELGSGLGGPPPVEIRPVPDAPDAIAATAPRRFWFRAPSAAGIEDQTLNRQVLAWMSDYGLARMTTMAHVGTFDDPSVFVASIDHAMWFHRPVRAADWLLYEIDSPSAATGTALARGLIHTRDGQLVATVMQEVLLRLRNR